MPHFNFLKVVMRNLFLIWSGPNTWYDGVRLINLNMIDILSDFIEIREGVYSVSDLKVHRKVVGL